MATFLTINANQVDDGIVRLSLVEKSYPGQQVLHTLARVDLANAYTDQTGVHFAPVDWSADELLGWRADYAAKLRTLVAQSGRRSLEILEGDESELMAREGWKGWLKKLHVTKQGLTVYTVEVS
jgi:hypothetical protein